MTSSYNSARLLGFFGVAVIGFWLTISMISTWYLSSASRQWPTTKGRVVMSNVDSGSTTLGDWWAPSVKYEYQIGATKFQSGTIRFYIPLLRNAAAAEAIRSPYPVGQPVSVSYDPHDPGHSVLEPGIRQPIWGPALAALMFWAMTAFLYYEVTHPNRDLLPRLALALRKVFDDDRDESQEGKAA